jgi:hypothetical protein
MRLLHLTLQSKDFTHMRFVTKGPIRDLSKSTTGDG